MPLDEGASPQDPVAWSRLRRQRRRALDSQNSREADPILQVFHLYVTTYPLFFNDVDEDCDKTIFNYWWARYNPPSDPRNLYLTTDLRKELNGLVSQLNDVISAAVRDTNTARGSTQVHLVDVNPAFKDQHHWCEQGNFHEPDSSRQDTWFFLSAWPDVPIFQAAIDRVQQVTIDVRIRLQKLWMTGEANGYEPVRGISSNRRLHFER